MPFPSRRLALLAGSLVAVGLLRAEDPPAPAAPSAADVLPAALPMSRYEKMLARSPFSLPTAATPPPTPPPQPGWADALFINAVMTVGDRKVITIASRENNERFILGTGEKANEQGIELLEVQWSDQVGQTRAVVRKNNVVATLLFDQNAVRPGAGGPPGRMTSPPQGINPNPPGFKPRPNMPTPPPPPVAQPIPGQVTLPPGPPMMPPAGGAAPLPPGSAPNDFPRQRSRPIVAPAPGGAVTQTSPTPPPRLPRPGAVQDE